MPDVRVFHSVDELAAVAGQTVGISDWVLVDQARIDAFAAATDDHQWIHVDVERAADTALGSTIAHGYLTLSLLPKLSRMIFRVEGLERSVNYGSDKVRFPAPLPAGARVRDVLELVEVVPRGVGFHSRFRHTIEIEGHQRPACVAETISWQVPGSKSA